jgi:pilus assembly protein CpaE
MATKGIKVLIADNDPTERARIKEMLTREKDVELVEAVADGNECLSRALAQHPDVVILRSDLPGKKGIEIAENLYMDRPDIGLILMLSGGEDDDIWRQMVQAGINEFVTRPIDPQRLIGGIRKVVGIKRKFTGQTNGAREGNKKFIAVISARGGCGKTFLAANLAVAFSRQFPKVALADFTLTGGDAGMLLDLKPQRTLKDLFAVFGGLDSDVLDSMLARHSSGVALLSSPMSGGETLRIVKSNADKACELLHQDYDVTVADTDHANSELTQLAIKHADTVVVVTGADLPRLKSTKTHLQELTSRVPAERIKIVLNRYSTAKEINPSEAEAILEAPIVAHLPHDSILVTTSINHGRPLVQSHPGKPLSEAIMQLAALLHSPSAPIPATSAGRGGWRTFFNLTH